MKKIKDLFNNNEQGWTFCLGMTICMIFSSFIELAVFVCLMITIVLFGINSLKEKPQDLNLTFLAGAFWAQLLIWLI